MLLGGGGIAGIITAAVTWRRNTSDKWKDIVEAQAEHLIKPLEERIDTLEKQVAELETYKTHYMVAVGYLRQLFHWLAKVSNRIDADILADNPKPKLPDKLREEFGDLCDDNPKH